MIAKTFLGESGSEAQATPSRQRLSSKDWSYASAKSVKVGDTTALVRMIVFTDFECPFCKVLHERIVERLQKQPKRVALAVLHFPISSHRFAKQASTAFECAEGADVKGKMINILYAKQDSIGLLSWFEFGKRAGVRDSLAFEQCIAAESPLMNDHLRFGQALGITATPTVLVDGIRLGGPPTDSQLDSIFGISKR